jgi:sugar-specific transcriptional regulator TrmB
MGLGLSPNQAKVYQTILQLGNATVLDIAKSSSVRREDVYKVLPALEKMGLAEKLLGKPIIIRATPVAGALTSLILDEKVKSDERITSMKMKFQELSKAKWVQPVVDKEESLYALIPKGKGITAKLTSLIAGSKSNVIGIETLKEISHITSLLSPEFKRAIRNGVEVKLIIEDFNSKLYLKKQVLQNINIESINIRFNSSTLNTFAVFDGKDAMISTSRRKISEDISALWTTDPNLIGILRGYFESAWSESEDLNQTKSN